MTAARVMDFISRLPGCAGQAAAAVSAYTQVKMEDASKLLKIPKSECPDIWIRLPRHKWPKSWSSMEDPFVPLERNLYGHPLAGLNWERQFERILLKYGWRRFPIGNARSYTVKKGYSYLCMWTESEIAVVGTPHGFVSSAEFKRAEGGVANRVQLDVQAASPSADSRGTVAKTSLHQAISGVGEVRVHRQMYRRFQVAFACLCCDFCDVFRDSARICWSIKVGKT